MKNQKIEEKIENIEDRLNDLFKEGCINETYSVLNNEISVHNQYPIGNFINDDLEEDDFDSIEEYKEAVVDQIIEYSLEEIKEELIDKTNILRNKNIEEYENLHILIKDENKEEWFNLTEELDDLKNDLSEEQESKPQSIKQKKRP